MQTWQCEAALSGLSVSLLGVWIRLLLQRCCLPPMRNMCKNASSTL